MQRPRRDIRHRLTEEETILWQNLREFRASGLAFRRQVGIGVFTVDFLCRKAKLIVEVDGNHHGLDDKQWEHDRARTDWLERQGYKVIRFWNDDIHNALESVVDKIYTTAKERSNARYLPPLGGGGRCAATDGGGRQS